VPSTMMSKSLKSSSAFPLSNFVSNVSISMSEFKFDRRFFCGECFWLADILRAKRDLTLQVRRIHYVKIDQAKLAHARCSQIQTKRCAKAARADKQHFGILQLQCPSMPTSGMIRWRLCSVKFRLSKDS